MKKSYTKPEFEKVDLGVSEQILVATMEDMGQLADNKNLTEDGTE